MKHIITIIFVHIISISLLYAQEGPKKLNTKKMASVYNSLEISTNIDFPMSDMNKRYGVNNRIGFSLNRKMSTNFIITFSTDFLFGSKIKESNLFNNAYTSENGLINYAGEVQNPGVFERGYLIGIKCAKLIPLSKQNINNGIMLGVGSGFMQHKLKFVDRDNQFPQLLNEYYKGYDRLTNGTYAQTFVGYRYHSENKLINFYTGIETVFGFTKNRRSYTFDAPIQETKRRKDILLGWRFGWIIPIYKKTTEEKFY